MNQNNRNLTVKSLLGLFIKYPKSFLQQLNKENFQTLKRALIHESPSQIVSNARKLLQKTKKDSIDKVYHRIDSFVESIHNPVNKDIALFISHESTRTGAPLIILNIAKEYSKRYNVLPVQILCLGGVMDNDFKKVGDTYILDFYHNQVLLAQEISYLIKKLKEKFTIHCSFVNSEGSTRLLPHLRTNGAGMLISLIHEMGNYYPKGSWKHIKQHSDQVIFPAQCVKEKALENTAFSVDKIHVLGQGLMKPELLEADNGKHRRDIRKEFGIPENSKIVLGCGQPIPRKGFDIFIFAAISVLSRINTEVPVYFIWVGDADFNDHQIWANRDIQYSGNKDRIRFIGSKKNTIPYFKGSDIFLLTSRGDPFPCVAHEAMAAGMPVIGFKNAGGIEEMIDHNRGYLAHYGDIYSISNRIIKYLDDPTLLADHQSNARLYASTELKFDKYVEQIQTITTFQ